MALRSGDALGRYVIDDVIGQGGMGSVYRAHDTRLHRAVALKVLSTDAGKAGSSTNGSARILREARIAAKLEHANVVAIYDVDEITQGELAGTAYLAMELVNGRSLRSCIGDATIPIATRVRWLADVARGLAAAHDQGLVHRDVKPENVIVRVDGVAKVLDFGIAKHVGAPSPEGAQATSPNAQSVTREGALAIVMPMSPGGSGSAPKPVSAFGGASVHSPSITGEGIVIGTPYYMSPEQLKGLRLDARTDQFSWGVIAYELVCGRPPWSLELGAVHVVAAILGTDPVDPREVNPEIPGWLAGILLRATAKTADARFASMHEVVARLEAGPSLDAQATAPVRPAARTRSRHLPSRRRVFIAAIGATLAAVVATGVGALRASSSRAAPSRAAPTSAPRPAPSCESNAKCTASVGAPAICTAGHCAALASTDCHVAAAPAALTSESTLWIGSLYPETGAVAPMGQLNERATELARRDFAEASALGAGGDRVRPVGLVACDDGADAERATRHLVEDLDVPAIVGFKNGDEILSLSGSLFGAHHTLVIATLTTNPLVTQIPHVAGEPPLVWRTTYSLSESADAMAALVKGVLEPQLRAEGSLTTRVALLRLKSPGHLAFSEHLFDTLRYNGKSALDNGGDFGEFVVDWDNASPETYRAIVERLREFAPNVVLYTGKPFVDNVIGPLEATWPKTTRVRPRYVSTVLFDDAIFAVAGADRDTRRRMFAFTLPSTTPVNGRYTLHYNDVYGSSLSRADAPSTAYDGFYVAAYAALALGDAPATGPNLASAIGKLVPPGAPIEVGPSGIYQAFSHLRAGESIDLAGAGGPLDFDLSTGESLSDLSVLCLDLDKHGKAASILESGMVYVAKTGGLEGKMRCP